MYSFNGDHAGLPTLRTYPAPPAQFGGSTVALVEKALCLVRKRLAVQYLPTYRSLAPTFICSVYSSAGPEEAGVIDLARLPVGRSMFIGHLSRFLFLCPIRPCRVLPLFFALASSLLSSSGPFILCLRISFSLRELPSPSFCFPSLRLRIDCVQPISVRAT